MKKLLLDQFEDMCLNVNKESNRDASIKASSLVKGT